MAVSRNFVARLLAAKPLRVLEVALTWGAFTVLIFDLAPHYIDHKVSLILWLMNTYTCWALLNSYIALHEIMVTDSAVYGKLMKEMEALSEGKGPHVKAITQAVQRDVAALIRRYAEGECAVKELTPPDSSAAWKEVVGVAPKEDANNL